MFGQETAMRPIILALCAAAFLSPAAALAATPAAPAATGGVAEDARCLLTMAAFTGAKDQNTSNTAQLGVIYFAGRIKARDPSFNLATRLPAVAASMNGKPMQAEADRCGPLVLEALKELQGAQAALGPPPGAKPPAAPPPIATPPAKH
jgi:hypothetical protein